jgi:outer membrane murein-binding lipoprotein Lpp
MINPDRVFAVLLVSGTDRVHPTAAVIGRCHMGNNDSVPEDRQLAKIEDLGLEDSQLADQLYNSAGLNPVVDAGLKDYDKRLQREDKVINKVLGPRGSDIRGYGEAVAKRVALAVYGLLNKQYGGQMGDLRSYILALEDERNRANTRYDELMGRVIGTLGEEYRDLRTDSNAFMEKLTTVLGEDARATRIDQAALAERLADIDGLRTQVRTLTETKERLEKEHASRVGELDSKISGLESEKAALTSELARLKEAYDALKKASGSLSTVVGHGEIGDGLGEELYAYVLKDSKVPHAVVDGVGKFIDFRKYLRLAAARGAEEATRQSEQVLRDAVKE